APSIHGICEFRQFFCWIYIPLKVSSTAAYLRCCWEKPNKSWEIRKLSEHHGKLAAKKQSMSCGPAVYFC
uniref:Uncharacterized protein n=1 Tax=Triticum urartu TaxID=4572 RepID=A0A8R7V9M6_TRIUA